jgi:hypothetical protein
MVAGNLKQQFTFPVCASGVTLDCEPFGHRLGYCGFLNANHINEIEATQITMSKSQVTTLSNIGTAGAE